MSKRTPKRLTAAQGRLRKIEELIEPYAEDLTPRRRRAPDDWMPGDDAFLHDGQSKNFLEVDNSN